MKHEMIYAFRVIYDDLSEEVLDGRNFKPEFMYSNFEPYMDFNEFDGLPNRKYSVHQVLELGVKIYSKILKPFKRLEIINIKNNKIIDYINVK